jgi:hypothetical protein
MALLARDMIERRVLFQAHVGASSTGTSRRSTRGASPWPRCPGDA